MPKIASSLFINTLQLDVHLGWPDEERIKKQIVWLDVSIAFSKVPKACVNDHIKDTVCYDDLIQTIRKKIATKKFRLIEHLAAVIHKIIKNSLPKKNQVGVNITKYPKIKGLNGGVSFHYGDHQ